MPRAETPEMKEGEARPTFMAYIMLLAALVLAGSMLANIVGLLGVPQYAVNLAYGAIIALYVMENWVLLRDLRQAQGAAEHEQEEHRTTIHRITEDNNSYRTRNNALEERLRSWEREVETRDEEIKRHKINAWKNIWDDIENDQEEEGRKYMLLLPSQSIMVSMPPKKGPQ